MLLSSGKTPDVFLLFIFNSEYVVNVESLSLSGAFMPREGKIKFFFVFCFFGMCKELVMILCVL